MVLSAVIIGSFAPDFEFFLSFTPKGNFGHTAVGLFCFSLPVALAVFWLFHAVVKEPLAALMPQAARQRIASGAYQISLRVPLQLALVVVSILVGEMTHVLWDAFTHAGYWPSRHIAFLRIWLTIPHVGSLHVYKLLQYVSSIAGVLGVWVWFLHWLRTSPVQAEPAGEEVPRSQVRFGRVAIPLLSLIGAAVRAQIADLPRTPDGIEIWLGDFAVTAISLAWLQLMAWGLLLPRPAVRDLPPTAPAR